MRCIEEYSYPLEKYSIKLSERPNPVPYNYRITFRMAELCLILKKSTSRGGVSLSKINMITDAISSQANFNRLMEFTHNDVNNFRIKYDPIVIKVLQYAIYDGLVIQQKDQKYKLTKMGKSYVGKIIENESLLVREKKILDRIGQALKEDKIGQLQLKWRYRLD